LCIFFTFALKITNKIERGGKLKKKLTEKSFFLVSNIYFFSFFVYDMFQLLRI
jgi:hypothetical protein